MVVLDHVVFIKIRVKCFNVKKAICSFIEFQRNSTLTEKTNFLETPIILTNNHSFVFLFRTEMFGKCS